MLLKLFFEGLKVVRDCYLFLLNFNEKIVFERKKKNSIIVGNGPSLNNFLDSNRLKILDYELFVCNGFVSSDEFNSLKPENYCLLDPLYFDLNNEFVLNRDNDVLKTWELLISRTTWPMTLIISINDFKKLDAIKILTKENPFLNLRNLFPLKFHSIFKNFFYSQGIGLIADMTVTHLALHSSILKHNESIYLVGIDHDWFKNINYEEETHEVSLLNSHFYGAQKLIYGKGILMNINLAREFDSIGKSFLGFEQIDKFAKYVNVEIYRASKSFLHFFPFEILK